MRLSRRPPRGSTLTNWDSFRTCRAARTYAPITNINEWAKQLQSDVQSVTRPLPEDCPSDTVDSRLLHLWDAKASLERRWRRQRWNRTLRRRLARLIKEIEIHAAALSRQNWDSLCDRLDGNMKVIRTLQAHTQQTTRLIRRIANRRAGLRERNTLRLTQAYVISRTTYALPYLPLRKKERDRINALLRSCTKTALRLPPSTSNERLLKLGDFLHILLTCPTFPHPPSPAVAVSYWESTMNSTSASDQRKVISCAMKRIALQGLSSTGAGGAGGVAETEWRAGARSHRGSSAELPRVWRECRRG
ncbi:hypothetical protein HPB50_019039 [Hyalomma asiaticum]|uniref:Uncharacterized protein n=1 Tax=Hyalomma asiaticum TaxID=266040 RepID=A0ACB7SJ35_HYAAI|nr:hypothetical protein HPB50_019039 [Hyalomma asiaticum]